MYIRARSGAPNGLAAGQTSPAKRASPPNISPSRAPRVSPRRPHETDASQPPLRPYIRIFVTKHAFPALAAPAAAKGVSLDDDASRSRACFASRPRPNTPTSIPPASLGACRARADEGEPAPIRPNIVAAVIREPAIPGFSRPRRRRASAMGLGGCFGDFGARGTASCLDLDRSVFARQNTFVACIVNI
jgi:hypothetical protein